MMNSIEDVNFLSRYPLIEDPKHKSNHHIHKIYCTTKLQEIEKSHVAWNTIKSCFHHRESSNIELTAYKVKTNSVFHSHPQRNHLEDSSIDNKRIHCQQNDFFQEEITNKRTVVLNESQPMYYGKVDFRRRSFYSQSFIQQNEENLSVKNKQSTNMNSKQLNLLYKEDKKIKFSSVKKQGGEFPSYTAMIAQSVLSTPDHKITLGGIYEYIELNYGGLKERVKGWRNCVRHNLSLNECFVKLGRSRNGRGNNWIIHPNYLESFLSGEYRKRRARRLAPTKPKPSDCASSATDCGVADTQFHQMPSLIRYVQCGCACNAKR